ncbi:MAG: hypothetical protein AAFY65_19265 [Pseudomonadota bacterium]
MQKPPPQPEDTRPTPRLLPSEVCKGALTQALFEGYAPSESRMEILLDRLERTN